MKLIHDEGAYRRLILQFVACRSTASVFIAGFSHLWKSDASPGRRHGDVETDACITPGFYGLMDAVNALCGCYVSTQPDGCGYRVSEAQFRREISALVTSRQAAFAAPRDGDDRRGVGPGDAR